MQGDRYGAPWSGSQSALYVEAGGNPRQGALRPALPQLPEQGLPWGQHLWSAENNQVLKRKKPRRCHHSPAGQGGPGGVGRSKVPGNSSQGAGLTDARGPPVRRPPFQSLLCSQATQPVALPTLLCPGDACADSPAENLVLWTARSNAQEHIGTMVEEPLSPGP